MRAHRNFLASVTGVVLLATPAVSRACRYCEMAADPEAYRFTTERRSGGAFPIDSGTGGYADIAPAPVPANLVTDVSALQKLTPHQSAAPLPAASLAVPAAPRRIPPAAGENEKLKPPSSSSDRATLAAASGVESPSARLADLGLTAVGVAVGWFVWRTRRRSPASQPAAIA